MAVIEIKAIPVAEVLIFPATNIKFIYCSIMKELSDLKSEINVHILV